MGVFYTVFNPNGEAPARKKYGSHGSAFKDACRLADANPGEEFYVMRASSRPLTAESLRAARLAKAKAAEAAEAIAEGAAE